MSKAKAKTCEELNCYFMAYKDPLGESMETECRVTPEECPRVGNTIGHKRAFATLLIRCNKITSQSRLLASFMKCCLVELGKIKDEQET